MPVRCEPVSRNDWKHNLICYFAGACRAKSHIRPDQKVPHDDGSVFPADSYRPRISHPGGAYQKATPMSEPKNNTNLTIVGMEQHTTVEQGFWFRVTRRPSILGVMLVVVVFSWMLCQASNPAQAFDAEIITLVFAGLLAVPWLIRLVALSIYRSYGYPLPSALQGAAWAILPAMTVLTTILIHQNVPVIVRLKLSEGELISFVRDIQSQKISVGKRVSRPVGLFQVTDVKVQGDYVRFTTGRSGLLGLEIYGLAYCPGNTLPAHKFGTGRYEHLHGPWWMWRDTVPLFGPGSFPTFHIKLDQLF